MSRYARRALAGLASAFLVLTALACGSDYPQSSIDPGSDLADAIHSLYRMVFWITLAILVIVWGLMGYIVVRFRARPDTPTPRQIHGHLGMELVWTFVPAVIVVMIAVPSIRTVFATQRPPSEDALVVDVIGHQFWWEFRYPDGVVTAGEVHLPVGRPVSLRMRSADVIHSFWVPRLGGKRDVNPAVATPPLEEGEDPAPFAAGGFTWLHFTIHEPGVYRGQCAELCGFSHSLMGVRVIAEPEAAFDAWRADWRGTPPPPGTPSGDSVPDDELVEQARADSIAAALQDSAQVAAVSAGVAGEAPDDLVELGRQTFHSSTCIACHAIQGTTAMGQLGPNLTLFGRRATLVGWLENNSENLARWIGDPQSIKPGALMPGVAGTGGGFPPTNLSEEQVRAIAEYLLSLGRP